MKKSFVIPPYGNLLLADGVLQSVQNDTSVDPNMGKILQNKEKVAIMEYENGEKRLVFLLPMKTKNGFIQGIFPDPVLLYLEAAQKMLLASQLILQQNLPESMEPSPNGKTYIYSSQADFSNSIFNSILQYRITSIIMLHAAVEAFVNELIPDDISYPTTNKDGNVIHIGKEQVFWLPFVDKIKNVIPFVTGIDLSSQHSKVVDKIDYISQVRNGLVHLKSESSGVLTQSYSNTFYDMLKLNLEIYFDAVHNFIEILKPGYIKYY